MGKRSFHLEPIQRIAIYQEVIERLEKVIAANGLQPGDQLPSDRQLSEQLGVSRASVRMALKVLESYGRVTAQQGSGTFVSNPAQDTTIASLTRGLPYNREFILQLAPLRNAIDLAIGEAAWPHRTSKNLALVWDTIQARSELIGEDDERGCSPDLGASVGQDRQSAGRRKPFSSGAHRAVSIHARWRQTEIPADVRSASRHRALAPVVR
jgi:GntR family transcriptional repressor for pyruvate dehydrogenase complex